MHDRPPDGLPTYRLLTGPDEIQPSTDEISEMTRSIKPDLALQ